MAHTRTSTRGASSGGDAVIGETTRIRGRVSGDGDLTLAGTIEGDIALRGSLTIEGSGSATSNVEATAVTVSGTLEGDVSASGPVLVASGARVKGNLRGSGVAIEEGAQFSGRLDMDFELPEALTAGIGGGAGQTARRR